MEAHPTLPGELLVVYNAKLGLVEEWAAAADLPAGVLVAADPGATLYEALGTARTDPVSLAVRSLGGALKSARQGLLPRATSADMLRLGADVAVREDGTIALLHTASTPDDRIPVERLAEALHAGA